jgi:putative ABC transport system substrate-binding protein
MKKIMILALTLCLAAGCKKNGESMYSGAPQDLTSTVGIAKIISHPALDAVEKGVQDELASLGFVNLRFDLQSADGDMSNAGAIANQFKSQNNAVSVGIATPMALALASTVKGPIVFSAVTDPIYSGLRTTKDIEKTNIAGVSDMSPVREQFELLIRLTNAESVGYIYNMSEINSLMQLNILQELCDAKGLEFVTATINSKSEVKQATEALVNKGVDAIFIGADNLVAASITDVTHTALKAGIPVIGSDVATCEQTGALAAYGVDYYKAGRQTGKIVAQILAGTDPGYIPVKYMTSADELSLYIDYEVAGQLGITIPEDLRQ